MSHKNKIYAPIDLDRVIGGSNAGVPKNRGRSHGDGGVNAFGGTADQGLYQAGMVVTGSLYDGGGLGDFYAGAEFHSDALALDVENFEEFDADLAFDADHAVSEFSIPQYDEFAVVPGELSGAPEFLSPDAFNDVLGLETNGNVADSAQDFDEQFGTVSMEQSDMLSGVFEGQVDFAELGADLLTSVVEPGVQPVGDFGIDAYGVETSYTTADDVLGQADDADLDEVITDTFFGDYNPGQ